MAKIQFNNKVIRRKTGGLEFDPHIQPPDFKLPWYWRAVAWALKPFAIRVIQWMHGSLEQMIRQSAGVLTQPLLILLDDVVAFLIESWNENA